MTRTNPVIAISDSSQCIPEPWSQALMERGYRVVRIPDKSKCLGLLKSLLPDLVVTNLISPTMDGLELLEEIKSSCRIRDIPVIMTSEHAAFKAEALNLGAKEFLSKPFEIEDFMRAVKSAVSRSPWYDQWQV